MTITRTDNAMIYNLKMEDLDFKDSLLNQLAYKTEQADPFCCRTEWQFSYHEAFRPFRRLYIRANNDSLIAFAGHSLKNFGYMLEPIESSWCFASPLLGDKPIELLMMLLKEKYVSNKNPWIMISGLLPHSDLFTNIVFSFGGNYEIIRLEPSFYRSASLEGGLEGYLSRRSSKLRRNIRHAQNKAAKIGISFERVKVKSLEDVDAIYNRMLSVEERSWKGIKRVGMNVKPSREFYRFMLKRMFTSSCERVMFARYGDRDIGYIFGGVVGKYYRGQQFSYDEQWRSLSLGSLLQIEKIRWLCEDAIQRYDMGQALEYKTHWAEIELMTETILLRPL